MKIFRLLHSSSLNLAAASGGNPVISTATVMLFFVFFNIFEGAIEALIFGERFQHWLDPIFSLIFIAYAGYAVVSCAVFNTNKA